MNSELTQTWIEAKFAGRLMVTQGYVVRWPCGEMAIVAGPFGVGGS